MREELFFAKVSSTTNEIDDIIFGYQPENNEQFYFVDTKQYQGIAVVGGHFDPHSAIFVGADPAPQEINRPKLIVISVSSTSEIEVIDNQEVRCQSGTTLEFVCHLVENGIILDDNPIIPMTGTFITPIYKMAAGQIIGQRLVKTVMMNGIVNISVNLPENGEWHVTEGGINSNLDPSQKMSFGGVKMMVYD